MTLHDPTPERRAAIEDALSAALVAEPDILVAWLFGSFARGEVFEDIDVGVLVVPERSGDWKAVLHLADRLAKAVGEPRVPIDLIDLRGAPYRFQHSVLSRGRLLACRDELARVRYESDLAGRYLDFKPVDDFFDRVAIERARGHVHG